jgi:hypothetical protein
LKFKEEEISRKKNTWNPIKKQDDKIATDLQPTKQQENTLFILDTIIHDVA